MNEETLNEIIFRTLRDNLHLNERVRRYRTNRNQIANQYQVLQNQHQQQLHQNNNLRNQVNQLQQQLGDQNMADAFQKQIVQENATTYNNLSLQVRNFNNPNLERENLPTFGGEIYEVLRYITEVRNYLRGNDIDLERFDAPGILEHNPGIVTGQTNCTIEVNTIVSHAICIAPTANNHNDYPAPLAAAIANARPSYEGIRIIPGKLFGTLADQANTWNTSTTVYTNIGTGCKRMQKIVNQVASGFTGEAAEWWNSLTGITRPRTFENYQFDGAAAAIGFFSLIKTKFLPAQAETTLYTKWKGLNYANYPRRENEPKSVRDFLIVYDDYYKKGEVNAGNDDNKISELIGRFNLGNNFERKIIEEGRMWLSRRRTDNNDVTYDGFKKAIETHEIQVINPDRVCNILAYKGSREANAEKEERERGRQWQERDKQRRFVRGRSPVYQNQGYTTRESKPLRRSRSREIMEVTTNGSFSMGRNDRGAYGGKFKARIQGCFNCAKEGHFIRDCPHNQKKPYQQNSKYMRRSNISSRKQNNRESNERARVKFNTNYNSTSNYSRSPSPYKPRDNRGRFVRKEVHDIKRIPLSRRITSIEEDMEN